MGPIPGATRRRSRSLDAEESPPCLTSSVRTITYPNKDGYALTVKSVPESWGDVTVKRQRIDASNNLTLVSTKVSKASERAGGTLNLSGAWARARPTPPSPRGAAQGLDLVVVTGTGPRAGQ